MQFNFFPPVFHVTSISVGRFCAKELTQSANDWETKIKFSSLSLVWPVPLMQIQEMMVRDRYVYVLQQHSSIVASPG
jgi:hypothetical protein